MRQTLQNRVQKLYHRRVDPCVWRLVILILFCGSRFGVGRGFLGGLNEGIDEGKVPLDAPREELVDDESVEEVDVLFSGMRWA